MDAPKGETQWLLVEPSVYYSVSQGYLSALQVDDFKKPL